MNESRPALNRRIYYTEILKSSTDCMEMIEAYRNRVLPHKTRTIRLLGRKGSARIINTLLGFEVQASYKRIQCPDMVTARYIRLFSEIGCHSIKLPYDPTVTAKLIAKFEAAIEDVTGRIRSQFPRDPALQGYATRRVYRIIREQLG